MEEEYSNSIMQKKHNENLTCLAQNLRGKSTKEENKLWYQYLKNYKFHFKRQYVIQNYIVDFYCPKAKLAIELDGSQHYEPQAMIRDQIRTENIEELGIEIIRFPNDVVNKKFNELCEYLDFYVQKRIQNNL